jgi:hypothetical protein
MTRYHTWPSRCAALRHAPAQPLYTDVVDGETVWKTPLIDSRNWRAHACAWPRLSGRSLG